MSENPTKALTSNKHHPHEKTHRLGTAVFRTLDLMGYMDMARFTCIHEISLGNCAFFFSNSRCYSKVLTPWAITSSPGKCLPNRFK